MSIINKRSLFAFALACPLILSKQTAFADPLRDLQSEETKTQNEASRSQQKIDSLFEQNQELLFEYRAVVDEAENLKVYNDHVQSLVDDQNMNITSLQRQIEGIEETKQGVVPLMYRMINTLDKFIELDVPVALEARKARVAKLRELMTRSNITTSEKYRQVLEAYQIENDYGNKIATYQGELNFEGNTINVDFFHMGRVVFVAQSLDMKHAWIWDNTERAWKTLGDDYLRPITQAIRMARKQVAFDLVRLPVAAAETAK